MVLKNWDVVTTRHHHFIIMNSHCWPLFRLGLRPTHWCWLALRILPCSSFAWYSLSIVRLEGVLWHIQFQCFEVFLFKGSFVRALSHVLVAYHFVGVQSMKSIIPRRKLTALSHLVFLLVLSYLSEPVIFIIVLLAVWGIHFDPVLRNSDRLLHFLLRLLTNLHLLSEVILVQLVTEIVSAVIRVESIFKAIVISLSRFQSYSSSIPRVLLRLKCAFWWRLLYNWLFWFDRYKLLVPVLNRIDQWLL